MRSFLTFVFIAIFCIVACDAKRSSRSSSSSRRRPGAERATRLREEEIEERDDFVMPHDEFSDEDSSFSEVDEYQSYRKKTASTRSRPTRESRPRRAEEFSDDDYIPSRSSSRGNRPPPRRSSRSGPSPRSGRVVAYGRKQTPSSLSRGFEALRNSMPDPTAVRDAAVNSLNVAREATSGLSANLYREVKGLTSSELEQVMLKATRPDDNAVKGKHVERLVGVTYQISSRYDIYDAVLRKLWAKMAEKDWRTTIKALYILHRFSADGAPDHAPALKARLRELRRTRDPKRKEKYFNSKQLLAGDNKAESAPFRAFMSRYAHYVLLRAQCFGGMFQEITISTVSGKGKSKQTPKPITSTALRSEHLEAAKLLLKAGIACQLKAGEDCENTAIAAERVAADLIGLTGNVAKVLTVCLKEPSDNQADPGLLKKWCEFYSEELLKETRLMVKKTAPTLDAHGLFLPSRMGPTVPQDLLQKGLQMEEQTSNHENSEIGVNEDASREEDEEEVTENANEKSAVETEEAELDDDYEYDDEEAYYDEDDEEM